MTNILEKLDKMSGGRGRKFFNSLILHMTKKYQKKYGFEIGEGEHATWNNEADAFKHAYMQWAIDYYTGSDNAKVLGDMHEDETPYAPYGETNMDLWNNAIGREISYEMKNSEYNDFWGDNFETASSIAARKIIEKMEKGELITDPRDVRRFENMELERLDDSDRVFYKGEFTNHNERFLDSYLNRYLEQAIENDWKIPDKENLEQRVLSGELIYVEDYTKSNGAKVNGYYRRKPTR